MSFESIFLFVYICFSSHVSNTAQSIYLKSISHIAILCMRSQLTLVISVNYMYKKNKKPYTQPTSIHPLRNFLVVNRRAHRTLITIRDMNIENINRNDKLNTIRRTLFDAFVYNVLYVYSSSARCFACVNVWYTITWRAHLNYISKLQ